MASGILSDTQIYVEVMRMKGRFLCGTSNATKESYGLYEEYTTSLGVESAALVSACARRGENIFKVQAAQNLHRTHPMRMPPHDKDDQGIIGYTIASKILEQVNDGKWGSETNTKTMSSLVQTAMKSVITRSQPWLKESIKGKVFDETGEGPAACAQLYGVLDMLRSHRTETSSELNSYRSKNNSEEKKVNARIGRLALTRDISIVTLGTVSIFTVGKDKYLVTHNTIHRVFDLIERMAILCLVSDVLAIKGSAKDFLLTLFGSLEDIWEEGPSVIGAAFKAAKQILILRQDKAPIMLPDPQSAYMNTLSAPRRQATKRLISLVRPRFYSELDAINFLNMYKGVMLVDISPPKLISEIIGAQTANPVDPNMTARFTGAARRAIYMSLRQQKHDVRAATYVGGSKGLFTKLNAPQCAVSSVSGMALTSWAGITFTKLPSSMRCENTVINPGNKSSSKSFIPIPDELEAVREWSRDPEGRKPEIMEMMHTMNDVESVLNGTSQLELRKAIKRFQRVIAAHEAFEATFARIEDIRSEDLVNFLEENPEAAYVVSTEPKMGEFHKEVTRTFYMAEQMLKALTQAVERLTKQISRKQVGVSIVKGFAAKRKELEEMCSSMTGDGAVRRAAFVSFDMAEFSKKFPGELIRIYGKILSELTGEDWLKRIDLFFRATVVYMNSRGFADWFSGVLGGFEGFLNFVWSSIHACVMEVALDATGCPGSIMVYSDDGLLKFIVREGATNAEVMALLIRIQDVYRRLGLIFHLSKTLISYNLWEYLGEFCLENRLMDSWVKELSSITRNETGRGLRTRALAYATIQSKAEAAVKAGLPNLHGCLIATFLIMRELQSLVADLRPIELEMLVIIPIGCSGFRVNSVSELGVTSKVPNVMEFDADLIAYCPTEPVMARRVAAAIRQNLKKGDSRIGMIIRGSYLSSNFADTSGIGATMEAIETAKELSARGASMVSRPVSPQRLKALDEIAKNTTNLDMGQWAAIIQSTPDWKNFTKSMAMVSGGGGLKLISRSKMKPIQRGDTLRVIRAIHEWMEVMRDGVMDPLPWKGIVRGLISKYFKDYDIARPHMSARLLLTPTKSQGDILVTEDFPEDATYASLRFNEPRVDFPASGTSMAWFSEASGATVGGNLRSFLDKAARFIVANPGSLVVVKAIAAVFGLFVPHIPAVTMTSLRRRTGAKGTSLDVLVPVPHGYLANTTVLTRGEYTSYLYGKERADRTTLRRYARLAAYIWRAQEESPAIIRGGPVQERNFIIRREEWESFHYPPEQEPGFLMPASVSSGAIPKSQQMEFRHTVEEYAALQALQDSYTRMTVLPAVASEMDRLMVQGLQEEALLKWLGDLYSWKPFGANAAAPMAVPSNVRVITLQRAVVRLAVNTSSAAVKATIRRAVLAASKIGAPIMEQVNEAVKNLAKVHVQEQVEAFIGTISNIVSVLDIAGIVGAPAGALVSLLHVTQDLVATLVSVLGVQNLLRPGDSPLVIIRPSNSREGLMSTSHRNAFKVAMGVAIDNLIGAGAFESVEGLAAGGDLRLTGDEILDYLYLFKYLVRESEHRSISHPYNRKSAFISIVKLHTYLRHLYRRVDHNDSAKPSAASLEAFRMTRRESAELSHYLNIANFAEPFDRGFDHSEMIASGLPPTVLTRVLHHWNLMVKKGKAFVRNLAVYSRRMTMADYNAELSALYSVLIAPAASTIVEYPQNLMMDISMGAPDTPAMESNLVAYSTTGNWVNGTFLHSGGTTHYEGLQELVPRLLEHHMGAHAVGGYSCTNRSRAGAILREILADAGAVDKDGPSIGFMTTAEEKFGGSQTYVFCLEFPDLSSAAGSFHSLVAGGDRTVVLVRAPSQGRFLLVGITSTPFHHRTRGSLNRAKAPSSGSLESLISPLNIEERTLTLAVATAAMTGGRREVPSAVSTSVLGTLFARVRYAEAEVNEMSAMLQAASDVANDEFGAVASYQAYLLAACAMSGNEDIACIDEAAAAFKRAYKAEGKLGRRGLMSDVTAVTQWLTLHPITAGVGINTQLMISARAAVSRHVTSVMPPMLVSLENPLSMRDLPGRVVNGPVAFMIGRVGALLTDDLSGSDEDDGSDSADELFGRTDDVSFIIRDANRERTERGVPSYARRGGTRSGRGYLTEESDFKYEKDYKEGH